MSVRMAAKMFIEGKASLSVAAIVAPRADPAGPDGDLAKAMIELSDRFRTGEIDDEEARREVTALLEKH